MSKSEIALAIFTIVSVALLALHIEKPKYGKKKKNPRHRTWP